MTKMCKTFKVKLKMKEIKCGKVDPLKSWAYPKSEEEEERKKSDECEEDETRRR